jgi:hypothetical protein
VPETGDEYEENTETPDEYEENTDATLEWTLLIGVAVVFIVVATLGCCVILIGCLARLRGYDWYACWRRFPRNFNLNGNDSMFDRVERVATSETDEGSVDSEMTVLYDIKEEELSIQGLAQAILEPVPAAKPVERPRKHLAKGAEEPHAAVMGHAQPINVERGVKEELSSIPRRGGLRTRSMGGVRREDDEIFYDII